MPAAIAIPAIIGAASAGSSLVTAKMGSNAAKNAAKTQSASADKALQFQQQQYQQQRQDFAPYQQQGANAVGQIGQMAQQPRQTFDPNQPQGQPRMPMGNLGNPMAPQMGPAAGPPAAGGGLVTVQGPDGSQRQVPQALAQQLVQRGGRIVQ